MNAMAAFYERLGLPLAAGHPDWTAHHRSAPGIEAPDVELDASPSPPPGTKGGTAVPASCSDLRSMTATTWIASTLS